MAPRTVIVPLDGSPAAEAALAPALALAQGFAAEIHLIRSTWHRPPDEEIAYLARMSTQLELVDSCSSTPIGFPANTVVDLVASTTDPVLCLASRGHTGISELALGSVAVDILRRLTSPAVLVGPRYERLAIRDHDAPIVYCYDGSPAATRLEPMILEWATELGLPVRVTTALHRNGEFLGNSPSAEVCAAGALVAERFRDAGVAAERVLVEGLEPSRTIADDADAAGASLVAAGATGGDPSSITARLTRSVLGSTAERLVRRATVPVLIAPG